MMAEQNQPQSIDNLIEKIKNKDTINIYAIQNKKTGQLINYKNVIFYTTRAQARKARQVMKRNDVKIVKTDFVKVSSWKTAR